MEHDRIGTAALVLKGTAGLRTRCPKGTFLPGDILSCDSVSNQRQMGGISFYHVPEPFLMTQNDVGEEKNFFCTLRGFSAAKKISHGHTTLEELPTALL